MPPERSRGLPPCLDRGATADAETSIARPPPRPLPSRSTVVDAEDSRSKSVDATSIVVADVVDRPSNVERIVGMVKGNSAKEIQRCASFEREIEGFR